MEQLYVVDPQYTDTVEYFCVCLSDNYRNIITFNNMAGFLSNLNHSGNGVRNVYYDGYHRAS